MRRRGGRFLEGGGVRGGGGEREGGRGGGERGRGGEGGVGREGEMNLLLMFELFLVIVCIPSLISLLGGGGGGREKEFFLSDKINTDIYIINIYIYIYIYILTNPCPPVVAISNPAT